MNFKKKAINTVNKAYKKPIREGTASPRTPRKKKPPEAK